MKKIEVNRTLHLNEVSINDAPALFEIIDNQRNTLREYLPFVDYTKHLSDTEEYIRSVENGGKSKLDTVFTMQYNKQIAGLIGYKDTDIANKHTEIGYWLSEQFRGKGLATLACTTLIQHAFNKMGMNKVRLKIAVNNQKSIAVAERLGFTLEERECNGELLVNGFTDLLVYAIYKGKEQLC